MLSPRFQETLCENIYNADGIFTIRFVEGKVIPEPSEIIFEVTEAVEGGYNARALGYSIFTQGDDWADLKVMVKGAVACHFGEQEVPKIILHS